MKEELVIPEDRPLTIRRILDILNSGPKLSILKVLLDHGELSAKEIADKVKIKLPTVLSHLSDLVKAGLVKVDVSESKGRRTKKYSLMAKKLVLNINLDLLTHLEEHIEEEKFRELEYLAIQYINIKRKEKELPLTISVRDVAKTLGLDLNTAVEVTDFINTYTDRIIDYLCGEALELIKSKGKVKGIKELASLMKVHQYWAALITQALNNRGLIRISDNGIIAS